MLDYRNISRIDHYLLAALLLLEHLGIEVQLLALKNVSVNTAGLAGSGGHASEDAAGTEAIIKSGVKGAGLLALSKLLLEALGLLGVLQVEIQISTRYKKG